MMNKYTPSEQVLDRIANDFAHHKPHADDQTSRYGAIRGMLGAAAMDLTRMCPPSRELSLALTHLEEAMFFANASIARNEKPEAK